MNRRRGFTFVELMVVMLLLGALSSMAVPRFREYKVRAFVAAMQSDLGNLKIAEETFWAEQQRYATDTASLEMRITRDVNIKITSQDLPRGYTAIATHPGVPNRQCQTAMGPEAAPREAGAVFCGPAGSGSTPLPPTP